MKSALANSSNHRTMSELSHPPWKKYAMFKLQLRIGVDGWQADCGSNLVGEHLREVPVVERDGGLDSLRPQRRDEVSVVLDALGILRARPTGKDSSPRDGES